MKYFKFGFLIVFFFSCKQENGQVSKDKKDSVQAHSAYSPGLGEFMLGVQTHHIKIWFAGINQNWELAKFEMDEMHEVLDNIKKNCADRNELKYLPMILPALDSLDHAIEAKNLSSFKGAYILTTNLCNHCHRASNHSFNVITIPEQSSFPDQDFKKH